MFDIFEGHTQVQWLIWSTTLSQMTRRANIRIYVAEMRKWRQEKGSDSPTILSTLWRDFHSTYDS